jgi:hypothetical protein
MARSWCDQTEPKSGSITWLGVPWMSAQSQTLSHRSQGVRAARFRGDSGVVAAHERFYMANSAIAQTMTFRWNLSWLNMLQCPAVFI